jgi:hypothetical protein
MGASQPCRQRRSRGGLLCVGLALAALGFGTRRQPATWLGKPIAEIKSIHWPDITATARPSDLRLAQVDATTSLTTASRG